MTSFKHVKYVMFSILLVLLSRLLKKAFTFLRSVRARFIIKMYFPENWGKKKLVGNVGRERKNKKIKEITFLDDRC